jgi:hypothetical protein
MAIVQISKIQQRSGNLVDLPQLDEAELGWAIDDRRLFVGRGGSYDPENIEVLTSYSNISFSQVVGSDGGNFNITSATNGQLLTYVASTDTWENYTGNSDQLDGGKINLGDVANIRMDGGAIGYVLETDGTGNLAWTPKGALYTNIVGLSNANPIVMTVDSATPYTNDALVTISGVNGASNTIVNGQSFYIQLAVDYATSGNVTLYTDPGGTNPVDGAGLTYTNSPNAIATSIIATGGGTGAASGSTTSVQYNSSGIFTGDAYFTWDFTNKILSVVGISNVSGNLNVGGNIDVTGRIISDVVTGTAPLQVSSTTRVANLNVATSGVANTVNDSAQPNITSVGTLVSLAVTGNANVGNLGTSGLILATGNITGGNIHGTKVTASTLVSNVATGTAPFTVSSTTQVANLNAATAGLATYATTANSVAGANVSGAVAYATTANSVAGANVSGTVSSATTAGTVTTAAQPNITSTGTLTSVTVTGNTTTGGVKTDNYYYANGSPISFAGTYNNSNVASYLPTYTGTVGATALTTGANTTAGTITGNWSLSTGSKLQSTYADLAEYYEADQLYEPGTVLQFGGEREVTIAEDGTTKVAGVVSTNPAYAMNANCQGIAVAIALQGRVPTKVRGTIRKGDMMVSAGNGFARPWNNPQLGTVIGKALENFDGIEGIIEIAIGRL